MRARTLIGLYITGTLLVLAPQVASANTIIYSSLDRPAVSNTWIPVFSWGDTSEPSVHADGEQYQTWLKRGAMSFDKITTPFLLSSSASGGRIVSGKIRAKVYSSDDTHALGTLLAASPWIDLGADPRFTGSGVCDARDIPISQIYPQCLISFDFSPRVDFADGRSYEITYETTGMTTTIPGNLTQSPSVMLMLPFRSDHVDTNGTECAMGGYFSCFTQAYIELSSSFTPTISTLAQFTSDGTTTLPESGVTSDQTLVFKATPEDPNGDQVKVQVELKAMMQPFDGTNLTGSGFVASGASATITSSPLSQGLFHWRARSVDDKGNAGVWQEFGAVGNVDLEENPAPPQSQSGAPFFTQSGSPYDGWIYSTSDLSIHILRDPSLVGKTLTDIRPRLNSSSPTLTVAYKICVEWGLDDYDCSETYPAVSIGRAYLDPAPGVQIDLPVSYTVPDDYVTHPDSHLVIHLYPFETDPNNRGGWGQYVAAYPAVAPNDMLWDASSGFGFTYKVDTELFAADPCATPGSCVSNVLFLPGIEGSRLYEGTGCGKSAEEKLWEPDSVGWSSKMQDLSLGTTGESNCSDIYTKEGDIVGTTGGGKIYQSLIDEMNGLKSAGGPMRDWEPVAYDWRLSLPDLLNKGAERNGKIYYEEATSTPYIEQTLRALAASSNTGKVTIIAHSNGGLVAKALMKKLGDAEAAKLIDRVILVAVPQSGAPASVASLLVGYQSGLYADLGFLKNAITIVSNAAARAFAQNSPMAYHLLPSQAYFDSVMYDPTHPVASFIGDGYTTERAAYGNAIGTEKELTDFLLAKEGGRTQAADGDLNSLKILNPALISYATSTHALLDYYWTPPPGIKVDQIAGWGVDTVAGINLGRPNSLLACAWCALDTYQPILVEDGDGTVPVPSALMMGTGTNVKNYWLDLFAYNGETHSTNKHANLFEIPSLQDFIKNLLENSTSVLPSYIQDTRPSPNVTTKKLTYFLHSPLTLELTDASGHVTGLAPDGSVTEDIPGSSYGEFGEVKYVTVPEGNTYQLAMHGLSSGTFSLDMQERSGNTVTASSTVAGVPTTASTTVTMAIPVDVSTPAPMNIDENGDGTIDHVITPELGETVVFDITPPELKITFATSTNALSFIGTDDMGTTTVTTTTEYPPLQKKQKGPHGTATTTVIVKDAAGNTTALVYTEQLPSPNKRDTIVLKALAYNGATTTLKSTSISYKWRDTKKNVYKVFATFLRTSSSTLESHYQPKKNKTIIMTRPQDLDDRDDDDDSDMRPTKQKLPGMVVPYMTTEKGSVIINY